MSCSTSSFSRRPVVCRVLVLLLLSGCAWLERRPEAPLALEAFTAESRGPSVAPGTEVRWTAAASGGSGELTYQFRSLRNDLEIAEQEGPSPTWSWKPKRPGSYRLKVTITDSSGASVDSGWSAAYVISPAVSRTTPLAVLPPENLSSTKAPLATIRASLRAYLAGHGFQLIRDDVLERFMERHRIRYTGGLDSNTGRAFRDELGAEAVLATSLESYQETQPPRIALLSRLILTGEQPQIAWMDSVGLSGDDSPGLLGLGLVEDPAILLETALASLATSLASYVPETTAAAPAGSPPGGASRAAFEADSLRASERSRPRRRHKPRMSFRSPIITGTRQHSIAVVPFLNLTDRTGAGKIMTLHFVNRLLRYHALTITEPGLVREQLLKYRIIMAEGPSLANADLLFSERSLGVDLVLSGRVFDYQDAVGTPTVDFSVTIFDRASREVVWASRSHSNGDEGVFFFDLGRIRTANHLATAMVRETCEALLR